MNSPKWLKYLALGLTVLLVQVTANAQSTTITSNGPCQLASGQNTCNVTIAWTTQAAPIACLWLTSGNLFACGNPTDVATWPWTNVVPDTFVLRGHQNWNDIYISSPELARITVQATPAPGSALSASFVGQSVPTSMVTGQQYPVYVTMKNEGTSTWNSWDLDRLGSQNPTDNGTWGLGRVAVPTSVSPGQTVTFSFYVTAPSTPGTYNFQWQMVRDGVAWYGTPTPNVSVAVTGLEYSGYIDTVNQSSDKVVRGWICNKGSPYDTVGVLVYRNGRYIGRTTNYTEYRPTIAMLGYCGGNTNTGWRFTIPDEEFDGTQGQWSATAEYIPSGASVLETAIPYAGGGYVAPASLPVIPTVTYVAQPCYTNATAPAAFGSYPGALLETPGAWWNFATKANGAAPLNAVTTWNGGVYTGANVSTSDRVYQQRGDARTSGSESADTNQGRAMLQLAGCAAGVMLNTYTLDAPPNGGALGGPGGYYGVMYGFRMDRKLTISPTLVNTLSQFQPGRLNSAASLHRPFATSGASLEIDGWISVPWLNLAPQTLPSQLLGQVNYYVYFWDPVNGGQFTLLFEAWESNAVSSSNLSAKSDGVTSFVGQRVGENVYGTWVTPTIWGAQSNSPGTALSSSTRFKVRISRSQITAAVTKLNTERNAGISLDPSYYVLIEAGFQAESLNNYMSLGTSITGFTTQMIRN